MNQESKLSMTELDYLTASPHLQMIKAALPYIHLTEQRFFSLMVKVQELARTVQLFSQGEDGAVGICSLEGDSSSPVDMLNAMKPYANAQEQDFIDLAINFMQGGNLYQAYRQTAEQDTSEAGGLAGGADGLAGGAGGLSDLKAASLGGSQAGSQDSEHRTSGSDELPKSFIPKSQGDSPHRNPPLGGSRPFLSFDQLKGFLPPEQQSRLETAQLLMQTFQQT